MLAVRNAVMKYHGGIMIPEGPAKGEKAENGLIEEACKTIRVRLHFLISDRRWDRRQGPIGREHYPMDRQVGGNMLPKIRRRKMGVRHMKG